MSKGGHLVSIASSNENNVVFSLRGTSKSNDDDDDVWIGLKYNNDARAFAWSDGTVTSYRNWSAGEPSSSGDCVRMNRDSTWADSYCSLVFSKRYYVCENSNHLNSTIGTNFCFYVSLFVCLFVCLFVSLLVC